MSDSCATLSVYRGPSHCPSHPDKSRLHILLMQVITFASPSICRPFDEDIRKITLHNLFGTCQFLEVPFRYRSDMMALSRSRYGMQFDTETPITSLDDSSVRNKRIFVRPDSVHPCFIGIRPNCRSGVLRFRVHGEAFMSSAL